MKLETPKCPECGAPAKGTLETVTGCALLQGDAQQGFEYAGQTEVFWDEQKTVEDTAGKVTLLCHHGHNWQSEVA